MTIQDLLKRKNIQFMESGHHHCRPNWVQLRDCPYCGSHNYHLGYSLHSGWFVCWRCRGHHPSETFERLGISREEAKGLLRGMLPPRHPQRTDRRNLIEPAFRTRLLPPHKRYLRDERHFDCETIKALWKIEGIGIAPRLSWRIYIPIYFQGEKVSWTTRAIGDQPQRYISASAKEERLPHKTLLYGADYCYHTVVVCEGPLDAWAIGPGAVALFGVAYSRAQLAQISKYPYRYVCLDSSPEAQSVAADLCQTLAMFPGHTENLCLDAKDPGSASRKELDLVRKTCRL